MTISTNEIAYLNGQFVESSQLAIPPYDAGFLLGVTIAEQARTFGGRPFWLAQHLQRLSNGLELAGIRPAIGMATLRAAAHHVAEHNHSLHSRSEGDDIGITVFVTPGAYAAYGIDFEGPTVAIHTYPLQFRLWAERYRTGQRAVISDFREVPTDCWPAAVKCRSRMHYYLASQAARERDIAAIPILLDHDGFVAETPIASVVAYSEREGFSAPRPDKILPGISLAYVKQWAAQCQIPFHHRDLRPADLLAADEVLLTSTPFCTMSLVSIDGLSVGRGIPGGIYSRLIDDWSNDVGVSIPKQAARYGS